MKPGRSKRFILIFSSLLLLLTPVRLSDACGWSDEGYEPFTVILDRGFYSPRQPKKFELFSNVLFNFDADVKDDHEKNVEEWKDFLSGVSKDEAYNLVYGTNQQELNLIYKNLTNKSYTDEVTKALSNVEWQAVVPYLIFVRKCQPYVNEFDDWSGCFEKQDVFSGLFQEGEAIAAKASSDFLKVRIGYQLGRLAHYMGQFSRCSGYYEQIVQPLKPESIVYYWAMAHYAAALKADGKLADAQFHYAQVYRHCTTKRLSSFRSMYYTEIDSALSKCQDPADKISLYVLNSLENGSGNLANLEAIYQLDPMSPELEVLLYKEIYAQEMNSSEYSVSSENQTIPVLLAFSEKVIEGGKMFRPYVWHLSAGYLSFLNKSYDKAHEHYTEVKATAGTNTSYLKQYVTLLEVVLRAAETQTVNTNFEESMHRYLVAMAAVQKGSSLYEISNRISQYVYQLLYKTYQSQGEIVKAELVAPHFSNSYAGTVYDHPDSTLVTDMIEFIGRDDLNAFEKFLVEKSPYAKDKLIELQGTVLFRAGNLEQAVKYFDESGALNNIEGDPFVERTLDCIDCGEPASAITYTKKTLALQMMKYEKLAVSEPKKAAEYYYLLGNAWYNITYYGQTWQHLSYSRTSGSLGDTSDPFEDYWKDGVVDTVGLAAAYIPENTNPSPPKAPAYFHDCTRALSYYKRAFKLSNDSEFKAKCVFMAAKCEENARQVKEPIAGLAIGSHKYYGKLYDEYANTRFYSEIIQECSYLRNYKEFRDSDK